MKKVIGKFNIFILLFGVIFIPANVIGYMQEKDSSEKFVNLTTTGGGEDELPVIHSEKHV